MPFIQKKPQVSSVIPLYTLGLNKTKLIVGLGNIGRQYYDSRHNVGFDCLDAFVHTVDAPDWIDKKDLKCQFTNHNFGDVRVILIKPVTYMNLSGEAVQAVLNFYKISAEDTLVIHDELDIPFGQIRTRFGGSDAGHNGVKSIIQHVGEDFSRVRIGISQKSAGEQAPRTDIADFVLSEFSPEEKTQLPALKREASAILNEYIYSSRPIPHETRNFLV